MRFRFNNPKLKSRRQELRNNATEAERFLWQHLKKSSLSSLKFCRQYGAGPYVLDFYCPEIRLGIELDGGYHREKDQAIYDKDRDSYLRELNIKILRFQNNEVLQNIDKVLNKILTSIPALPPPL